MQPYFMNKSIENARMAYKLRCQMLEKIPGNFKNKEEEDNLKCRYCYLDEIMTQSHCLNCSAWRDLKTDLDLTNIDDMVLFFRQLLSEREKVDGPHCTTPATD